MENLLNKKIVHTLLYYDLFDYPLTGVELWQYVISTEKYGLADVIHVARNNTNIVEVHGFFCLKGRESIVHQRMAEYLWALENRKKIRRWLYWFMRMPFMRAVLVSGPLALDVSREKSDIDIFSITAPHRLWTARFFTALFLKIFRQRPEVIPVLGKQNGSNSGKFCFSMWCTEASLGIGDYALLDDDIHFALWLKHTSPVWSISRDAHKKVVQNNAWVLQYGAWDGISCYRIQKSLFQYSVELILLLMPDTVFQWIEWRLLPQLTRDKAIAQGTDVVITSECAKLHITDRRQEYNSAWRERVQAYESGAEIF
ncbi:MAG TPA: hypothetical protein VJB93_02000 [Patescibacteria group bacterium]|nr:hypothetical protein [Patescibacteria group bacterium]